MREWRPGTIAGSSCNRGSFSRNAHKVETRRYPSEHLANAEALLRAGGGVVVRALSREANFGGPLREHRASAEVMSSDDKTVKRAKKLLDALEKHAKEAVALGVPREIYVKSVADHAADTYDRLLAKKQKKAAKRKTP